MDLFSLVARLTLDDKEYEKALKDAEKTGKKAKLDVKGELTATDHYTAGLNQAQNAARNFHGNATGTISATDHYSEAIDAATRKGQEFNPDASDSIDVTADNYAAAMDADKDAAGEFEPGAEGTIGLTEDQFGAAMSDDEERAGQFAPDASGDIALGDDAFAAAMSADETAASTFDPQADGTIGVTDDYGEALSADETDAATAQLDADGTITGYDDYSDDAGTAQAEHDALNLDASGTLTIQTEEYETALKNAGTASTGFGGQMDEMISGISNKLAAAGIVGAVVAIGQAFSDAVMEAANYADTVDKGSRSMSISTDEYQKWRYALGQSGATISHFTRGVQNLNKAMGGAATEEVVGALNDLHIDPTQFETTEQMLDAVVMALAEMDAGVERNNLVTAIFGRNQGTQLNALLDSGAEGISKLKENAVELGLVMSGEDISEGVKFGDSLSDMNQAVDALKRSVVENLFPVFTDAVQMVTRIVSFLNGGDGNIETWFSDIDEEMKRAFVQVDHDEDVTISLIGTLKSMSDETGRCKGNLEEWKKVAEKLIELCPSLADQIDLVTGTFNEQNGSLKENARLYFQAARRQAYYKAAEKKQEAITKAATNLIEQEAKVKIAEAESDAAYEAMMDELVKALSGVDGYTEQDLRSMSATKLIGMYNNPLLSKPSGYKFDMKYWNEYQKAEQHAGSERLVLDNLKKELEQAEEEYEEFVSVAETVLYDMEHKSSNIGLPGFKIPKLDTQEAWYNMYDILRKKYGRDMTTAEMQALVDSGFYVPDALRGKDLQQGENLENVTIDGENVTIDGVTVVIDWSMVEGIIGSAGGEAESSNAKGLWSVPYDDYLANLHRDEMVLTASQARDYREGNVDGTGAIVTAIQELRNDMQNLKIMVGKKVFGETVVDYSGKRMQGYIGRAEDRAIAGYGWG